MRSAQTWRSMGMLLALGVGLSACDDAGESAPAGPALAQGPNAACSFNTIMRDIRSYFPGSGPGSTKTLALEDAASLEDSCDAGLSGPYTARAFQLLKTIETGLEGGLPDGSLGSPSTGNAIIQAIITMASPSGGSMFDPCGALPNPNDPETCHAWEGWPTPPDFTAALTPTPSDPDADDPPGGMFAVIGPGALGQVELGSSSPICSGPAAACAPVTTGVERETWGFAPEPDSDGNPRTWGDVQGGKTSLFWGYPIDPVGPTGETPLALGAGYFASSIPFYADFPGDNQLSVTFCTFENVDAGLLANVAHDASATESGTPGNWCTPGTHASASGDGLLGTLASLARSLVSPRPLFAGLHADSPVGGIGGFGSHFFAFLTDPIGMLHVLNGPLQDATTGGPIVGEDGEPLKVLARTSTSTFANPTGIENVILELVISNNNGSIPSGNLLSSSSPDVVCADDTDQTSWPSWFSGPLPPGNACLARTAPDQTSGAGIAVFDGLSSTKNGGFKVDVREWAQSTSPFTFDPVSAGQFNNNPN